MTKFLKIAVVMAFLGLCNPIFAEKSGGFLGLEVGYGTTNIAIDQNTAFLQPLTNPRDFQVNLNGGGVDFGFVGGYKQFFNSYFGLRYYANVNVIMTKVKPKVIKNDSGAPMFGGDGARSATLINYALNIDMLINFIARESSWNRVADFGAFVGIGLGGNNWSGKGLNEIDDFIDNVYRGEGADYVAMRGIQWKKTKRNFFDLSLNVGLRTNIAYNHGLELAFRIPLLKNTFVNDEGSNNTMRTKLNIYSKTSNYNVTFRYVYSFGSPKKVVRKVIKKRVKSTQGATQNTEQRQVAE